MRAAGDEIPYGLLQLVGRERAAEAELVQPVAAVFVGEGRAFGHGQRLQPHHIARQFLREADELVGEDRREDDEGKGQGQHEQRENEQRARQAPEAPALQPPHHGIEQIAQRDAGREGRDDGAEQMQGDEQRRQRADPDRDLPLDAHAAPGPGSIRSHLPPQGSRNTATSP